MLVLLASLLARMMDPLAWALCGIAGWRAKKAWLAAVIGGCIYLVLIITVSRVSNPLSLLLTFIAGALMACAVHYLISWLNRRASRVAE